MKNIEKVSMALDCGVDDILEEIVAREQVLRDEIAKIIAEIEVGI